MPYDVDNDDEYDDYDSADKLESCPGADSQD